MEASISPVENEKENLGDFVIFLRHHPATSHWICKKKCLIKLPSTHPFQAKTLNVHGNEKKFQLKSIIMNNSGTDNHVLIQ